MHELKSHPIQTILQGVRDTHHRSTPLYAELRAHADAGRLHEVLATVRSHQERIAQAATLALHDAGTPIERDRLQQIFLLLSLLDEDVRAAPPAISLDALAIVLEGQLPGRLAEAAERLGGA